MEPKEIENELLEILKDMDDAMDKMVEHHQEVNPPEVKPPHRLDFCDVRTRAMILCALLESSSKK